MVRMIPETPARRPFSWRYALLTVGAFSPALLLLYLVAACGVNVPYWDEWDEFGCLLKFRDGALNVSDIFAQHNEHRIAVSRLFALLLCGQELNVKRLMFVSVLLALAAAVCLYVVARRTLNETPLRTLGLVFVANLLIFGPIQYDNWLTGGQLVLIAPAACLCGCLALAASRRSLLASTLLVCVLSTFASFSILSGFSIWLIGAAALLHYRGAELREKVSLVVPWVLFFALNIAGYGYHYSPGARGSSISLALQHPVEFAKYFITFFGAPIGSGHDHRTYKVCMVVGALVLLITVFVYGYSFVRRRDRVFARAIFPWLCLGAYSLLTGIAVCIGRTSYGDAGSMAAPRYTSFSVYLIVALVFAVSVVLRDLSSRAALTPAWTIRISAALLTMLLMLHAAASLAGIGSFQGLKRDRLFGKAALLCIDSFEEPALATILFPNVSSLGEHAREFDRRGLLRPALLKGGISVAKQSDDDGKDTGEFSVFTRGADGRYSASGWSAKSDGAAVVFSVRAANGAAMPFGISELKADPSDAARARFERQFDAPLPPGSIIDAWLLEAEGGRVRKLHGEFTL